MVQRIGPGITVTGHHVLHVTKPATASRHHRPAQHAMYHAPVLAFSTSRTTWQPPARPRTPSPLPANVGLLTLQHLEPGTVLLRLQHLYGVGEDDELSRPATVALPALLSFLRLAPQTITETSLTANQARSSMQRLRWNGRGDATRPEDGPDTLTFTPLQIRTFLIELV